MVHLDSQPIRPPLRPKDLDEAALRADWHGHIYPYARWAKELEAWIAQVVEACLEDDPDNIVDIRAWIVRILRGEGA